MALIDNLVGYYKLDDNLATTNVIDSVGAHNGTLVGGDNTTTISEAGKIATCLHLDGSNDYIDLNWDFDPTSFSFAGWVWFDDLAGVQNMISDRNGGWTQQIQMSDSGELSGWIKDSVGEYQVTTDNGSGNISSGEWIHVALTYDGETLKLYVNGNLEDTNTSPSGKINNNNDLTLGAQSNGGNKLDGKLDEWGIWSRELSSTEVSELWNSGNGLAYPFAVVGTNISINIADTFKDVDSLQINIGDVWKDVVEVQQNIGDVWKTVF